MSAELITGSGPDLLNGAYANIRPTNDSSCPQFDDLVTSKSTIAISIVFIFHP